MISGIPAIVVAVAAATPYSPTTYYFFLLYFVPICAAVPPKDIHWSGESRQVESRRIYTALANAPHKPCILSLFVEYTGGAMHTMCSYSVMAESFSIERRKLMRFLGARVVLTNPAHKGTGMVIKAKGESVGQLNWKRVETK